MRKFLLCENVIKELNLVLKNNWQQGNKVLK